MVTGEIYRVSPACVLKNFDVDLQKFYDSVLCRELNYRVKSNAKSIKLALREVVEAYKIDSQQKNGSICFNTPAKRCAYVLKHSVCFTSAVARHLLKNLACCNDHVLEQAFLRGELNVCCLGGGPGSDAVAMCRILSWFRKTHCDVARQCPSLLVNVVVVDVNEDWKVTAENVLKTMRERKEFSECEVKLNFRFCRADLTRPFSAETREILEKADIVTMVFFLSAVNGGKNKEESFSMLQEIMSCLKSGALLFFLDSAREINYKQMTEAAATLGDSLEQVCKPRLEEFHTLSIASVKAFVELYRRHFGSLRCMTNCFVSSSAWVKLGDYPWMSRFVLSTSDRAHHRGPCPTVCRRNLSWPETDLERATRLTKRMLAFRAKVQTVFAENFISTIEDHFSTEEEVDDIQDLSPYIRSIPQYLFQTKSKKKRIFTGHPLSI